MIRAAALVLALVLAAGCKQASDAPPPPAPPVMPAAEIQRGKDACAAYVDKICSCAKTVASQQQPCSLARALPDAMQVSLDVAAHPDSTRRDVLQAHDSVRKIVKECIEATSRLAGVCP